MKLNEKQSENQVKRKNVPLLFFLACFFYFSCFEYSHYCDGIITVKKSLKIINTQIAQQINAGGGVGVACRGHCPLVKRFYIAAVASTKKNGPKKKK